MSAVGMPGARTLISVFAAAAVVAALLVVAMLRWTRARGILDIPNERSSHVQPTPRGGGVSVVAVTLVGELIAWRVGWLAPATSAAFLLGGALIAAVGAWDDVRTVSVRARLPVQFVAATTAVVLIGGTGLTALAAVVAIVWMTNLYNFMDGIDGIAGIQGVTAGAGGAAIFLLLGAPGLAVVALTVAGASLGFLSRNWSPARIFLGDVGSGFLGFTFGALVWAAVAKRGTIGWWPILPLLPFVLDATVTLLRRGLRRAPLTQAHREHVYQLAVIGGARHAPVALAYACASALLALAAFAGVQLPPRQAGALALVSVTAAVVVYAAIVAHVVSRSRTQTRVS